MVWIEIEDFLDGWLHLAHSSFWGEEGLCIFKLAFNYFLSTRVVGFGRLMPLNAFTLRKIRTRVSSTILIINQFCRDFENLHKTQHLFIGFKMVPRTCSSLT